MQRPGVYASRRPASARLRGAAPTSIDVRRRPTSVWVARGRSPTVRFLHRTHRSRRPPLPGTSSLPQWRDLELRERRPSGWGARMENLHTGASPPSRPPCHPPSRPSQRVNCLFSRSFPGAYSKIYAPIPARFNHTLTLALPSSTSLTTALEKMYFCPNHLLDQSRSEKTANFL